MICEENHRSFACKMSSRSAVVLCLIILRIVHCKPTTANTITDPYTGNITIEWQNFSIFSCEMTTPRPAVRGSTIFECPDENFIGIHCNISNNPCSNPDLCYNGGKCLADETLPYGYICQCPKDYSGDHCEIDDRICKNNTCWHDGTCKEMQEIVALVNETIFHCDCKAGYDGIRCQSAKNTCENITCENNGVCFSSYPTWTCVCLDSSLYSGTHCQHKSNALLVQQVLSKSFASIAITAIIVVFLFVTVMDVLKYGFKIDPVDRERRLMKLEEEKRQKRKGKKPTVIKKLQSYYIS